MPDSFKRRAMAILWPSFLMSGVLEGLVFAAFDPVTFRFGGVGEMSPEAIYTVSFFVFWLVLSTSGALTAVLWFEPDDGPGPPTVRREIDPRGLSGRT